MTTPFGDWRPDEAVINAPYLSQAYGVVPTVLGYGPAKGLTRISAGFVPNNVALGSILAGDASGSIQVAYVGASQKLYASTINSGAASSTAFVDVSKGAGNYSVGADIWSFAQYGNFVYATNNIDTLQRISVGGVAFADVAGSPPIGNGVFACGDFLFLANLGGTQGKLQWSGINNPASWTIGTNLSDEQTFPDGAAIYAVIGDKSGYVIQADAIRTFQFLPGDTATIFQFDKIPGAPGCFSNTSWASVGATVYYYSATGFYSIGPNGLNAIGRGKVDKFMYDNLGPSSVTYRARAGVDPFNTRVLFSFYSAFTNGITMIYDYELDRWGAIVNDSSFSRPRPVVFSDAVNLNYNYAPTAALLMDSTGYLCTLSGSNLAATLATSDIEFVRGRRALVSGWRIDSDVPVSSVAGTDTVKETGAAAGTALSGLSNATTGKIDLMASGRYHRFSHVIASGATWTFASGLNADVQPDGEA